MTREEAIKQLKESLFYNSEHEPVNMAIEALRVEQCEDTISRKAAIDALKEHRNLFCDNTPDTFSVLPYGDKCRVDELDMAIATFISLPSAQPEIIRCKDCIYYDPPHVENNGVRYEYDEMPADAFDALGTGLVNAEYGINIGGRCCVDYYCKNYSDDKRVFVREDNYCGRVERRTDE